MVGTQELFSFKEAKEMPRTGERYVRKRPIEIGNDYEVNITETTPNRAGMARIKGFLVLIDNTKPRDHLKVMKTKTDCLSAEAEIIN